MPRGHYDRKAARERKSLIVNGFASGSVISSDFSPGQGVADPGIIYKYNERDTFPQSNQTNEKVNISEFEIHPKIEKGILAELGTPPTIEKGLGKKEILINYRDSPTENVYEGCGLSVEELVWVRKLREVLEGMGGMGREEECVCFHCRTVVRRVVRGIVDEMRKGG